MNSDKELLELAAKTAGIVWHKGYLAYLDDDGDRWNPLVRDDHALRLAVKLGLLADDGYTATFCNALDKDDPYTATRRAIVRAAAEIGRSMG